MKFHSGRHYIVMTNDNKRAWLVQQTGQRTWVAVVFSDMTSYQHANNYMSGNSLIMVDMLIEENRGTEPMYMTIISTEGLRKCMFNVLKYGKFNKPEEV